MSLRIQLLLLFLFLISNISLISCGSKSQSPIATDYVAPSICPVNTGCADTTPKKDSIILSGNSGQTFNLAYGTPRFDMGGKCAPSTFPKSYVTVQVVSSSGQLLSLSLLDILKGSATTNTMATSFNGLTCGYVECINGKYSFSLSLIQNASTFLAKDTYTVNTSLVGIDSANTASVNPSGEGNVSFKIQIQ